MRAAVLVVVAVTLAICAGCRGGDPRSGDPSQDRRAQVPPDCADFATRLEASLRAVPRDPELTEPNRYDIPVLQHKRQAFDAVDGYLVYVNSWTTELIGVQHRHGDEPLSDHTSERVAGLYREAPPGSAIFIFANRDTPMRHLVDVVESVAEAERILAKPLQVRWMVKKPAAEYHPFVLPARTPTWVREIVAADEAGNFSNETGVKSALVRSGPRCQATRNLAEAILFGASESGLSQALVACGCEGLDFDAFEGLMLGLRAHVSPYGYVVLATSKSGATTVVVPKDAAVEDLAAAWPGDVDAPVFVKLE